MEFGFANLLMGCLSPGDQILRDEVDGLCVSTIFASDIGSYETAILDSVGAHPVERYESEEESKAGHKKWCELAKTLTTVTKLGYGELVDDSIITLRRFS